MKRFFICSLVLGSLFTTAAKADQSQLNVSRVSSILEVVCPSNRTTSVGLPVMLNPVGHYEKVAALTASSVTVAGTPYAAMQFALPTAPHSLIIIGGPNDGLALPIVAHVSGSSTLAVAPGAMPSTIKPGLERILVVPNFTLGTLLGNSSAAVQLVENVAPGLADKVALVMGGLRTEYFFNGTEWKLVSAPTGASQNDVPVPLDSGVEVIRLAQTPADEVGLVLVGVQRTGPQRVVLAAGSSRLVSNPHLTTRTLASSGLSAAVQRGSSPATADKVELDGVQYFFSSTANGWRLVSTPSGPSQDGVVLGVGKAVRIDRLVARTWPLGWSNGRPRRSLIPFTGLGQTSWVLREPFIP
jgi:hypothetical protein